MPPEPFLQKETSPQGADAVSSISAIRSGPYTATLFLFGQLSASVQTRAYTVDELGAAMQEAGYVDVAMQSFLPDLTFLVSGRKS